MKQVTGRLAVALGSGPFLLSQEIGGTCSLCACVRVCCVCLSACNGLSVAFLEPSDALFPGDPGMFKLPCGHDCSVQFWSITNIPVSTLYVCLSWL